MSRSTSGAYAARISSDEASGSTRSSSCHRSYQMPYGARNWRISAVSVSWRFSLGIVIVAMIRFLSFVLLFLFRLGVLRGLAVPFPVPRPQAETQRLRHVCGPQPDRAPKCTAHADE